MGLEATATVMGNVPGNVSPPGGVRPCTISDGRVSDSPGPVGAHQRGAARATDGVLFRILGGWASPGRKVGMGALGGAVALAPPRS